MSDKQELYFIEHWSGNSRDGKAQDIEGLHFLKMTPDGKILEAFEHYDTLDGQKVVTAVPEMVGVGWIKDLGYEDFEDLDTITEDDFITISEACTR